MFHWKNNNSLLNFLGQKVHDSRVTVTTDFTLRPCLLFMYQISKRKGNSDSMNKQDFTFEILRAKKKRIQTDCNNCTFRLCLLFMYKIQKVWDLVFHWLNSILLLNSLRQKRNDSVETVTTVCTFRPCLLFLYQTSKGLGLSASLKKHYFTLELLSQTLNESKLTVTNDCTLRPCLLFLYQNQKNQISCFIE